MMFSLSHITSHIPRALAALAAKACGSAAVLFVLATLAACQMNAFGDPDDDNNGGGSTVVDTTQLVHVVFTISVGQEKEGFAKDNTAFGAATRADDNGSQSWSDGHANEPASPLENYIDPNKLDIYFYDENGRFMSKVENVWVHRTAEDEQDQAKATYSVTGSMNLATTATAPATAVRNNNYRFSGYIVVYANGTGPANPANGDNIIPDVATNSFTRTPVSSNDGYVTAPQLTEADPIPMFGFLKVTNFDLTPGVQRSVGTISMLRAMAKMQVLLGGADGTTTNGVTNMTGVGAKGYELVGVSIDRYPTKGYLIPNLSATSGAANSILSFAGTDALTDAQNAHPYPLTNDELLNNNQPLRLELVDDPADAGKTSDAEKKGRTRSSVIYLPEYNNQATSGSTTTDNSIKITVTLRNKETQSLRTATFSFADYAGGNLQGNLNVIRNHFYKFYVYGNPLEMRVVVNKWVSFNHPTIIL